MSDRRRRAALTQTRRQLEEQAKEHRRELRDLRRRDLAAAAEVSASLERTLGRIAELDLELRNLDLIPLPASRCEQLTVDWLNQLTDPERLLDRLRRDPLLRAQPRDLIDPSTAAEILRLRDSQHAGRFERTADLTRIRGIDEEVVQTLVQTICAGERQPEPPPEGIGVLLPLRLETRFTDDQSSLRLRIIPDDVWHSRHDPRATAAELEALERYVTIEEDGDEDETERAWERFAGHHGGGRAAWLRRTFPALDTADDDEIRFSEIRGFPDTLEVWMARGGAEAERVATLDIDRGALTMDLAEPEDARWWNSWEKAVEVGLATTIDLGGTADDLDVLYVVGIGTDPPDGLFGDHRDSGRLGVLAPGTPTATVDGEPAADRALDPGTWWELLDDVPTDGQRRISAALTGDPDALGALPGGDGTDPRPLVTALWPALWGHAARDVWALGAALDEAAGWACQNLAPEGPFATLRVGSLPYGLLPVTALARWQPADDDPPCEEGLRPALMLLAQVWAAVAEQDGNVEGADAQRLLDLIAQSPTSPSYQHRLAWPLESWYLSLILAGVPLNWQQITDWWDAANPLPTAQLGLDPNRRYGSRGWAQPLELALVEPPDLPTGTSVGDVLVQLAELARAEPWVFASTADVEERVMDGGRADSLLVRLVIRSLQLALAAASAAMSRQTGPLLEPAMVPAEEPTRLARLIAAAKPAYLDQETPEVEAFARLVDAVTDLAGYDTDVLDRLLRATLDCATHRVDAWVGAPALRRLRTLRDAAAAGDETAAPRLGAYGWVDRPRPGTPGPTAGGLLQAPSEAQVITSAILRDRALNDDEPARWQTTVDSSSARAAERLARRVRAGMHLPEALGCEVERIVARRQTIDDLRRDFPVRSEHDGRRVCDGEAVLGADLGAYDLDADTLEGLEELRGTVDVYADLLTAEAVYHVVDGRTEAAGAAMEAAAGLARPPDLGVLRTRRDGQAVASRCVTVLAHVDPPAIPDDPAGQRTISPGVVADPAVADALRGALGDADAWVWQVGGDDGSTEVTLDVLDLEPVDALALPLASLERLAARHAGADREALVGADGSDRHRRGAALLGALGRAPATPADVADGDEHRTDDTATELRDRLSDLLTVGSALRARLAEVADGAGSEQDLAEALTAAARWGIAPSVGDPREAAGNAAERLGRRLDEAPDGDDLDDLDAGGLAEAIATLASATGNLTVLSRLRRNDLPDGLVERDDELSDWLDTVAPVREALARIDALGLAADAAGRPRPLRAWTNRPDDPWQTTAVPADGDDDLDNRRLVVAFARDGADVTDGAGDDLVAVGLVDRWSETVPSTRQRTATAFGFDAPAARAPQALLFAVPPRVGEPLDAETVVAIVAETRQLARARMATPGALREAVRLLPPAMLPAQGGTAAPLHPQAET